MANKKNNKTSNEEVYEDVKMNEEVTESENTTSPASVTYGKVVDCFKLNVRKKPNAKAEILGTINEGTTIQIVGDHHDFYEVVAPNGLTGFCMSKFVKMEM